MRKMKLKLITTVILLSTSILSNAQLNLQWEQDVTNYVGSIDYIRDLKQYSDNKSAVIAVDGSEHHILVFNSDGSTNFIHTISGKSEVNLAGPSSNPNYIMVLVQDFPSFERFFRIYSFTSNSFSFADSPYSDPLVFGSDDGLDPTTLFIVNESTVSKYKLPSAPSDLKASVASGIDGSNYVLKWDSVVGSKYQIQSSTNLNDWVDIGEEIIGNGTDMTWANALSNSTSFFRIIEG